MTAVSDTPTFAQPAAGLSAYDRKLFHRGHYAVQSGRAKKGLPGGKAAAEHHHREMRLAAIEQYITDTLAKAPPLSDTQRAKLAQLLAPAREVTPR